MGTISQQLDAAIVQMIDRQPKKDRYGWMDVCRRSLAEVPSRKIDFGGKCIVRLGDVLFQEHWTKSMGDLASGYLLGQFWHGLATGRLEMTYIEAGGPPMADKARNYNQALLDDLPGPFRAEVFPNQTNADSDGYIFWSGALHGHFTWGTRLGDESFGPLEIGSCNLPTIYSHIIFEGCVCRWPYGVPALILINRRDHGDPFYSNCGPMGRGKPAGKASKGREVAEIVAQQLSLKL